MVRSRWSDAELRSLSLAIQEHGCRWARIASAGLLPGRTAAAMRLEYLRCGRQLPVVFMSLQETKGCIAASVQTATEPLASVLSSSSSLELAWSIQWPCICSSTAT